MSDDISVSVVDDTVVAVALDTTAIDVAMEGALILVSAATGGTYTANYNEVFPVDFMTVASDQTIDKIAVRVVTAFNGTGASLKIGTSADDDRFFAASDVDLTAAGMIFEKDFDDDGQIVFRLTIAPGSGASQGQIKIQISTTKKGV